MLLSLALCLCLLEVSVGNLPKGDGTPNNPGFSIMEPEKPGRACTAHEQRWRTG